MLNGKKESSDHIKGFTLVEVLMSALLLMVIFLAFSALHVASHRFFLTAKDRVMIGYEVQYAIEHIYKNVMQGIGDKNNPAVVITPGKNNLEFTVRHIDDSPHTYSNYTDDKEITYTITGAGKLSYTKVDLSTSAVLEQDSDMIPQVTLLFTNDPATGEQFSKFALDGNVLTIKLTAEFPVPRADEPKQRLTLYSASYPRCASFQ